MTGIAPSRWDLPRPPGRWTLADAAIAALCLVALAEEIVATAEMRPRGLLLIGAGTAALPLAWRRSWPAAAAGVCSVGFLEMALVSTGRFMPQLAILPVLVALFGAASRLRGAPALATGASTLVLNVLAHIASPDGHVGDFWPWLLWGGAWAAGTFVRRRSDLAAHHATRAVLLEMEAETVAADSAERERERITRELHDVVAHSVSLMVVQAGAERLRLGLTAGTTREALAAIEEAGRQALTELRTMLGVLGKDSPGENGVLGPLPGLAEVPELVDRLRSTGLPVELHMDPTLYEATSRRGGSGGPATGPEMAAYRIVQEALTNVVRHAGLVPTRVRLAGAGHGIDVSVENEPPRSRSTHPDAGAGRGLVGMRVRSLSLGGSFDAGIEPEGGFRVHAVLPVGEMGATR